MAIAVTLPGDNIVHTAFMKQNENNNSWPNRVHDLQALTAHSGS